MSEPDVSEVVDLEDLSEEAVAAAFTTAGSDLGSRERATRDAALDFMRAVTRDAGSMPPVAPPILPS